MNSLENQSNEQFIDTCRTAAEMKTRELNTLILDSRIKDEEAIMQAKDKLNELNQVQTVLEGLKSIPEMATEETRDHVTSRISAVFSGVGQNKLNAQDVGVDLYK